MAREGFGYLNRAINHYGGFVEFRELLKRESGQPTDNERLTTLLERYVAPNAVINYDTN
ncbi:MAG: hypothetical protein Q7S74_03965 [Nanoarchaeota archaeon]|nr:hypothetical protein [Nanoarchaeota archaeon]